MDGAHISARLTVAEVHERWPQTITVFLRRRMACVGCSMAIFDTLEEAAAVYGYPPGDLLGELQQAVAGNSNHPARHPLTESLRKGEDA